jgi:ABC-type branched-subunit amino acid transport system permease subunit
MGLSGMVTSAITAVAGAIMYWAVSANSAAQNGGFRLTTIGVILMIAGGAGFIVSVLVFTMSRRTPSMSKQTVDRSTKNETGETTELHEIRK